MRTALTILGCALLVALPFGMPLLFMLVDRRSRRAERELMSRLVRGHRDPRLREHILKRLIL